MVLSSGARVPDFAGGKEFVAVTDKVNGNIVCEQARLAIEQIPAMQGTSSIVALAIAAVYWNYVPHIQVLAWILMIACIAVWRYRLHAQFSRALRRYFDGKDWGRRYTASTLTSGVVWGLSAFLLFPHEHRLMQALLIMVMTTLSATTTVSHSSIKIAPMAWSVPAILPYSIRCVMEGGTFGYTVAALLPLFLLTLGFYSWKLHKVVTASIALRYENLDLVEELRQATRLKDQFVSLVSHDLRGPIAGIKSTADYVNLLREKEGPEKIGKMVSSISEISNALLELLDQLFDISRLQTGKIAPINRTFFIRQLVDEQIFISAYAAEKKKITVINQLPADKLLLADRSLYGQVIGNLLSNAIKFSHPGGVIRIYAAEDGKTSVAVEDRGVGIDPAIMPDIFRHEVKTTLLGTGGERGTGLGLPLCMDIMKAHRGTIEVQSNPGEGSTFIVRLPVASRTVLVVDDLEAHRAIFKRALGRMEDISIAEAENGRDALEELNRSAANLIVTDLAMPEMNGTALLSAIRGDPRFKDIPVIVVTSDAGADWDARQKLRDKLFANGANDLLEKPVIEEEFIRCVRRLL